MASKITDVGDISNWNTSKMENCDNMFEQCQSLTSLNLYNWTTSACTESMDFLGGPYNDSLTTIVLGPNFFTNPTKEYGFFVNARHWSHDSIIESLITNQQTRDTSLVKTITLNNSIYNTLTQNEIDEMAALGLNVISN